MVWNGQKCDRKWFSDIQNGRRQPFCQKFQKQLKLCIDLKWPEMRSEVNFGHPKWPTAAILQKIFKRKIAYWSEMARNATKSDFRTSKMAAGSHFVKKLHKNKKLWYWSEMVRNAIQLDINSLLVNIYIYIQTAMLGTREYTLCSPFRANAHNSSFW